MFQTTNQIIAIITIIIINIIIIIISTNCARLLERIPQQKNKQSNQVHVQKTNIHQQQKYNLKKQTHFLHRNSPKASPCAETLFQKPLT